MNTKVARLINVPNFLTLLRIIVTPFVVLSIMNGWWGLSLVLFLEAMASDVFDGALARLFGQQTFLGACLDPIADKLLVIAAFSALCMSPYVGIEIPAWFIALITIKELLLLSGVLFFCFFAQQRTAVSPSWYGKVAAGTQMMSLLWIFICKYMHRPFGISSTLLCVLLSFIMIIALFDYFYRALYGYTRENL